MYNGDAKGTVHPMNDKQAPTFGLFKPMDPDASIPLGAYRFWAYTREGVRHQEARWRGAVL
jgi:hypothetical protein